MRYLLISLLFLCSCGSGGDNIPANILPKDKMVRVLTGIHIKEAEQQQLVLDQSALASDTFSFNEVFKKENITRAQYDSSMMFYTAHPQLLDQVYDEVINELNNMKSEPVKK